MPRPGLLAERTGGGGVDDIGIWHPVPVPNRLILSRANPDVAAGLNDMEKAGGEIAHDLYTASRDVVRASN